MATKAAQPAPLTQSYVQGLSGEPMLGQTIGAALDAAAARWGDRLALVSRHQNVRLTWGDLHARAEALAAGFLALGLVPGDRIGIWSPNNVEWALVQFASAKAGLILVNINPAYRVSELEYALNKVECRALVLAESFKSSDYHAMLAELAPELARSRPGELGLKRLPHLEWVVTLADDASGGMIPLAAVPSQEPADRQAVAELGPRLQFDDPINIQFTSGTTGHPKGATLSHHNILNNALFVGRAIRLTDEDRLCIPVPLYHCFGMVMGNLACAVHGATMVYPEAGFDALATLQAVAEERCTALYGVPTMFIAQLDHPEFARFDLTSLRTGIMAGSPCPIEVMKRVVDKMHLTEMTIAYGMTETSPVSFQSATDDSLERRVSTVGRVQPHLEVKIVDAEGRVTPAGEPGELCTRGYSVMLGYWNDADKTAEAIDRGRWMHTGDIATIDAAGYCNIVGRIKDMVIRGGENVYPREIEEFLYRHPKVADVQVIGVPDDRYGEELCAWIRLRDGEACEEEEIRAFCQGQIAHYKVPRYVKFVDAYPMTVTGKVQKFLMREQTIAELGLKVLDTA